MLVLGAFFARIFYHFLFISKLADVFHKSSSSHFDFLALLTRLIFHANSSRGDRGRVQRLVESASFPFFVFSFSLLRRPSKDRARWCSLFCDQSFWLLDAEHCGYFLDSDGSIRGTLSWVPSFWSFAIDAMSVYFFSIQVTPVRLFRLITIVLHLEDWLTLAMSVSNVFVEAVQRCNGMKLLNFVIQLLPSIVAQLPNMYIWPLGWTTNLPAVPHMIWLYRCRTMIIFLRRRNAL